MTPKWVVSGGIAQTISLPGGADLVAAVDTRYETSRETQLNYLPETLAPSYTRTDLSLTYHPRSRRWSVTGYLNNVENSAVIAQTQVGRNYSIANGGPTFAWLQPPREFGARVHWQY
jgi:iron complex outermembrane receptor protein